MHVDSLSASVLRHGADLARSVGADAEIFIVRELPTLFEPGVTEDSHPGVGRLRTLVAAASSLLVVTPIYGGVASGAVKNILDTLHMFKEGERGALSGRRVVVGAVGGGALLGTYDYQPGATVTLEIACQNLGAWVSPHHLEFSELMFNRSGDLVDELARDALRTSVVGLVSPGSAT